MAVSSLYVYVCKNDHLNYGLEKPTMCSECGSTSLEQIHGVMVTKEIEDVISEEPQYSNP